jgi:hypothetical protein
MSRTRPNSRQQLSTMNSSSAELSQLLLTTDSSKVKVKLRLTVSQSVSLSGEPHLGLMTKYLLLFDSYGLVLWGALSHEGVFVIYLC